MGIRTTAVPAQSINRKALLWLVPLVITVHNLEEAAGLPGTLSTIGEKLPAWAVRLLPAGLFPPTYHEFLVMLLIVTALPFGFALMGGMNRERGPATLVLSTFQAVMLVNVFSHLAAGLALRGYTTGIITAVVLNLPFSLFFFSSALRGGWLQANDLLPIFGTAVLLHGPGLLALFWLANLISPYIQVVLQQQPIIQVDTLFHSMLQLK